MQSYLGRMISTALPRSSNSRLNPKTTSARPPTLATGANSGAIITINMAGMNRAGGGGASCAPSSFFFASGSGFAFSSGASQIASSEIGANPETAGFGDRICSAGRTAGHALSVVGSGFTGAAASFATTNPPDCGAETGRSTDGAAGVIPALAGVGLGSMVSGGPGGGADETESVAKSAFRGTALGGTRVGIAKSELGLAGTEGTCPSWLDRAGAGVAGAPTDLGAAASVPVADLISGAGFASGVESPACLISVEGFAGSPSATKPGFSSSVAVRGIGPGTDTAEPRTCEIFGSVTDSGFESPGGGADAGLADGSESVVRGPESAAVFDGAGVGFAESLSSSGPVVGEGADFGAGVSAKSPFRSVFDEPVGLDFAI